LAARSEPVRLIVVLVCRPWLPPAEALIPYLRRADAARFYTNHGQLAGELTARLAAFYGLEARNAVLASNGTAAITGAILASAGRARADRDLCICPAYTFVATAVAAASCGYQPFLVDVDAETWALSPERLAGLPQLQRAADPISKPGSALPCPAACR
jgi:dTDP-4-amino-4,6-dideoxygalactose transaminase